MCCRLGFVHHIFAFLDSTEDFSPRRFLRESLVQKLQLGRSADCVWPKTGKNLRCGDSCRGQSDYGCFEGDHGVSLFFFLGIR